MKKITYLSMGKELPESTDEMTYAYKDVLVGYPVYDGRPELASIQSLLLGQSRSDNCVGGIRYALGDSLVTRARNKIVQKFMESEYQYLMFIDSDIQFKMEDINILRNHNKPLIGGVYLKKDIPYKPVANSFLHLQDGLNVMKEIGTGFMMIHRSVFDDIRAMEPELCYKADDDEDDGDYYDYFRVGVVTEDDRTRYLSEDYYFCYLARKAGHTVYYDTTVFTRHIGKAVYPFNDNKFLEATADLLMQYNTELELDKSLLDAIQRGVDHQKKARGW